MDACRRVLACLLVAGLLAGCSSWHATNVPEPAPAPSPTRDLGTVRVRLADGRSFRLEHARVDADSLRGTVPRAERTPLTTGRAAFALGDVRSFEVQRISAGRTVGLVVFLAVTVGGAAAFVIAAEALED